MDLDLVYQGLNRVVEEHGCQATMLTCYPPGQDNESLALLRERVEYRHFEPGELALPEGEGLMLFVSPVLVVLASARRNSRRQLVSRIGFQEELVAQVLQTLPPPACECPEVKNMLARLAQTEANDQEAFRFLFGMLDHDLVTRVNESRMYRLAEQSLDLIYRIQINPVYRILYISPIIETWMGCTREELYQDARVAFNHIHPEDTRMLQKMMAEDHSKQGVTQVRFLPAQGEPFWIEHRWFVDRSDDRSVIVLDGVGRDITRQKRQEEATKQALRNAEENARSKSLFLANMSHEIRTPLNAVIGQVELLKNTPLNEDQREMLESVLSAGKILLSHLTDVLDFSRLDAQRVKLQRRPFSLVGALAEVLRVVKDTALGKGLELLPSYNPSTPALVSGDKGRFVQIVLNLLSNAIKFTDQGSVRLDLDGHLAGDNWVARVRIIDTGIGFPVEDFEELAQPFSQADPSSTRKREGSGLGLAIVKRLAELMEARITVESVPNEGTCFELEFPFLLEPSSSEAVSPEQDLQSLLSVSRDQPAPVPPFPPDLKILVVEDNEVNRKVIRRQLSSLGLHHLDFACNGSEAIATLRPDHHNVVMMDIQMPVMDGVESLTRLKQMYPELETPFIAVTAHALPGDRETYLEAGFQGYLSKPVGLEQLRRVLSEVLG